MIKKVLNLTLPKVSPSDFMGTVYGNAGVGKSSIVKNHLEHVLDLSSLTRGVILSDLLMEDGKTYSGHFEKVDLIDENGLPCDPAYLCVEIIADGQDLSWDSLPLAKRKCIESIVHKMKEDYFDKTKIQKDQVRRKMSQNF